MKILLLDIETAPNTVYTWGLFKQNIAINQIDQSGYILCWAAKWLGEDQMFFSSLRKGKANMLERMHRLLSEADAVVTYNGKKFDIPTLNKEFLVARMSPPAPYKQIDLYQIVKSTFRFASNKLDWISQQLEIGSKLEHQGFDLWLGCMDGDKACWQTMEAYNRKDVTLLEEAYEIIRPWIRTHPSHGAHSDDAVCPKCGSVDYQQRGFTFTNMLRYRRYQCKCCGGWFRSNKTVTPRREERMTNIAA